MVIVWCCVRLDGGSGGCAGYGGCGGNFHILVVVGNRRWGRGSDYDFFLRCVYLFEVLILLSGGGDSGSGDDKDNSCNCCCGHKLFD